MVVAVGKLQTYFIATFCSLDRAGGLEQNIPQIIHTAIHMFKHPSGKAPLQIFVSPSSRAALTTKAALITKAADATAPLSAETGVLMLAYTAALPVGYLNAFATQQVRTGQSIAGVPIRRSAVETLFAAPGRVLRQLQAQSTVFAPPANAAKHTLRRVGDREFDWTRSEGLYCATNGFERDTAKSIMQHIPHPVPLHMFEGISRLNMEAKRGGYYVLMFAHFADIADACRFRDVTSELFHVAVCEPDPAYRTAFSIHSATPGQSLLVGSADQMVQVNMGGDGRYDFAVEDFVATSVIDRVMWKMRCDNAPLDKIGGVVGLNKSNVKRRLDKMRAPRPSDVSDDWRKPYDGLFDIPPRGGRLFDISASP